MFHHKKIFTGIGVRHAQILMVFFFLAISYLQRSDLSVTIVAMTNKNQANEYFQVSNAHFKNESSKIYPFPDTIY